MLQVAREGYGANANHILYYRPTFDAWGANGSINNVVVYDSAQTAVPAVDEDISTLEIKLFQRCRIPEVQRAAGGCENSTLVEPVHHYGAHCPPD